MLYDSAYEYIALCAKECVKDFNSGPNLSKKEEECAKNCTIRQLKCSQLSIHQMMDFPDEHGHQRNIYM